MSEYVNSLKFAVFLQDGLFLVQNNPEIVQNYQKAVLTPNVVEFKRLCDSMVRVSSCQLSMQFCWYFR
jgi:NAD(P)H-hydrate repair Nnr-like enzyme with NAD(P)H-hydrate dehydratase domain